MQCESPKIIYNAKLDCNIIVPCDSCYPCQCRQRAELALRCKFEIESPHTISAFFATFTYKNENLYAPYMEQGEKDHEIFVQMMRDKSARRWDKFLLESEHVSKFLQAFQKDVKKIGVALVPDIIAHEEIKKNRNSRYVITGEYGDITHRPHYHGLFFLPFHCNKEEFRALCLKHWKFGDVFIGDDCGAAAINYVGKHQIKQCKGSEFQQRASPIFKRMSVYKGGIGINQLMNSQRFKEMFQNDDSENFFNVVQGNKEFKVGCPRAVRKKMRETKTHYIGDDGKIKTFTERRILSDSEMLSLSRKSEETFKDWLGNQFLLDFDYLTEYEKQSRVDSFRAFLVRSIVADDKRQAEHIKKKILEKAANYLQSLSENDVY